MKRLALILLAIASLGHSAALLTGGNILQWPVSRDATTNQLVIKTQSVDNSGNTGAGSAVTVVNPASNPVNVSITNQTLDYGKGTTGSYTQRTVYASDGNAIAVSTTPFADAAYSIVYDAKNVLLLHPNIEDFLGNLSPTTAASEAFKYLSPSALTTVTIGNIGTGAGTVYVAFSNTSAALNPNAFGIPCVPGICTFTNPAGTFMHYSNANTLTITSAVHDWLTPALSGTTLPQTPPFN